MALRKASSYSKRKVVPYTRTSRRKNKSFVKVVPPQKITKFSMGNEQGFYDGKMPFRLTVVTDENVQIRHNALEACRQYLNKLFEKNFAGQYFFRVVPYPHHIQRENKMLTGAGADRMQTGMQLSFGKSMGKAAILRAGGKIFFLAVQNEKAVQSARHWINQVKPKLPCKIRILAETEKAN